MQISKKILFNMLVVLICWLYLFLLGCTMGHKTDKAYELAISAYKCGYMQGALDQMNYQIKNEYDYNSSEDCEKSTLGYIKTLGLDSAYYQFAKLSKK